ncbi:AfsR/SARP family transcriptional regulator [Streptomyces litchfieldiae]|uniref:AfsR/SARP family transcriptional regulator n=1 Tax=Streptomyces litchfieldiae TaxID=3075543 RepID=A0ABU2MZ30_9ACTN|nr:AfsR/SARP family transcriptional regulator [Streptomyces sp. DSM 44938]MDT0346916.1 AfsR/SARP family transcriptional regulator [Streptomyces sp. DSM 44938]
MEINILGPFTAQDHGVSIVPSAAKPRQLLALLALHADRVVTVSTLMEELWGESIPRSAATTLQTYILQLRRKIADALVDDPTRQAKDVLETRHGSYILNVGLGTLDYMKFEQLVESGRRAAAVGDHQGASQQYGQALALWRGPALVDVRVGSVLELEALRLEERRMSALERRIEADLEIGRHAELIPELRVLVAQQPLNENFCAQLMVALQGAGNPWRALEAYQRLRSCLVRELGLEPSVKLQRIQQAVLTGRPVG